MKLIKVALFVLPFHLALAVTQENILIVPKQTTVTQDSSEQHRINKKFQISAQLFGANPTATAGSGVNIGYFIDRNSMIIAEVTSSDSESTFIGSSYDVKGSSVGVHYKIFIGNSFYVRAGVDQRHVDYQYQYDSIFGTGYSTSSSFKVDSTAASLVIGNQWQWDNFTLGCDWIGFTSPFSHKFSEEKFSANADAIDHDRHESDKKYYGETTVGQGLRFYLGASF